MLVMATFNPLILTPFPLFPPIIAARIAERAEGDEHNMGQKIQRCLVQNQRVEDAASFARFAPRRFGIR